MCSLSKKVKKNNHNFSILKSLINIKVWLEKNYLEVFYSEINFICFHVSRTSWNCELGGSRTSNHQDIFKRLDLQQH